MNFSIENPKQESKEDQQNVEILYDINKNPNLLWQVKYSNNNKNEVKWIAFWGKQNIKNVGGYSKDEQRKGLWKDLFKNFNIQAQVFETGEYLNQIKLGYWQFIYKDKIIGGGYYNKGGQKKGKWIVLDDKFKNDKQITYQGEYNRKGLKVGRWDIMYNENEDGQYKLIGGGLYDLEENEKKIGQWIEIDEEFRYDKQVTYEGEYNMNERKIGWWDTWFKKIYNDQSKDKIGGGQYDQIGEQKKIGSWVELDEGFYDKKQVTYTGEYNMNGIKVNAWLANYCQYNQMEYKLIGHGSYDHIGNMKKIGKWEMVDKGFYDGKQIIYVGEYNLNGSKVGKWKIMYQQNNLIWKYSGGGSYDNDGHQIKIGDWIEIDEGFYVGKQVVYKGKYKNGSKVGRWEIMYDQNLTRQYQNIGGGQYDQEGIKFGKWTEIGHNWWQTYNGLYNKNGMKVGTWVEMDIEDNKKRGEEIYSN